MSKTLHLKVYVGVSVDLNALWQDISSYKGAHLSGGDGPSYIITYDGGEENGLNVLGACLAHAETGKFYADYS